MQKEITFLISMYIDIQRNVYNPYGNDIRDVIIVQWNKTINKYCKQCGIADDTKFIKYNLYSHNFKIDETNGYNVKFIDDMELPEVSKLFLDIFEECMLDKGLIIRYYDTITRLRDYRESN